MDLYCRICREPIDNDELHSIAAERAQGAPQFMTVGAMSAPAATYQEVAADFRKRGCVALYGSPCQPDETAAGIGEVYDLLGDDMDGAAGTLDDLRLLDPDPQPAPVSPYTNDFKDMGPALDPAMLLRGQREVLLAAVQRAILCPISGVVLDRARSVLVIPSNGGSMVMDVTVWDERHALVAEAAAATDITLEVYDGRELW